MDKFAQLAAAAQSGVVIMGNVQAGDFELIDLHAPGTTWREQVVARDLDFVGVAAFVDGTAQTALAVELDVATIQSLSQAFIARYESRLNAAITRECDWMRFAQSLYGPEPEQGQKLFG